MPFNTKDPYEGLSGQVWGSHVYYESTKIAYREHGITDRPIALSRDNGPNWRTPDPLGQTLSGAGSPAHHRFPVWWTGDGVPLLASVESMVNEAVHDFRAFVHSDCGGHGSHSDCPSGLDGAPSEDKACSSPNDAALLRWTAHCVLGTVVRFHQVHFFQANLGTGLVVKLFALLLTRACDLHPLCLTLRLLMPLLSDEPRVSHRASTFNLLGRAITVFGCGTRRPRPRRARTSPCGTALRRHSSRRARRSRSKDFRSQLGVTCSGQITQRRTTQRSALCPPPPPATLFILRFATAPLFAWTVCLCMY
jgi:hypothetical protein